MYICFQTNTGIQSGHHVPVISQTYCFISSIPAFFFLQDIQLSVNSLLLLRDQNNMHGSSPLSVFGGSEEKTRNRSDQIQVYPSSPNFTVSPSACEYFTTHSCSVCHKLIPFLVVLKKIPLCASLQGSELQLPVHISHTHSFVSGAKCYKRHGFTLTVSVGTCNFVKYHSYYGMLHSRLSSLYDGNARCSPQSKYPGAG